MSDAVIAEINQLKEELRIVFEKIDMAQKLGRIGEDWLDRLSDEREQIAKQIAKQIAALENRKK